MEQTSQGFRPFESLDKMLKEAGLEPASIECIALGLGPGSYAGTRTAISIAQGWQLARGVKVLGIGSANAIAQAAQRTPMAGTLNIVFDAQRNESYAVRYEINAEQVQRLGSFEVLTPNEEAIRRAAGESFLKGDTGPWGRDEFPVTFSDARVIGELAAQRNDFMTGSVIEPIYLRKAEFVKATAPRFTGGE